MIGNSLNIIGNKLNDFYFKYENIILIGDFNSEMREDAMNTFCITYNLACLIREPNTCFKNIDNSSCIDLILTNKPLCFQNTSVIETGLSDFHKLCVNTMRASFPKQTTKILNYGNYKYFNNEIFRNDLLKELSKMGFSNISCEAFEHLFINILNKHAPMKKRYIRANNSPFMTNTIYKAIMLRSELQNKSRRLKTIEFREAYK